MTNKTINKYALITFNAVIKNKDKNITPIEAAKKSLYKYNNLTSEDIQESLKGYLCGIDHLKTNK